MDSSTVTHLINQGFRSTSEIHKAIVFVRELSKALSKDHVMKTALDHLLLSDSDAATDRLQRRLAIKHYELPETISSVQAHEALMTRHVGKVSVPDEDLRWLANQADTILAMRATVSGTLRHQIETSEKRLDFLQEKEEAIAKKLKPFDLEKYPKATTENVKKAHNIWMLCDEKKALSKDTFDSPPKGCRVLSPSQLPLAEKEAFVKNATEKGAMKETYPPGVFLPVDENGIHRLSGKYLGYFPLEQDDSGVYRLQEQALGLIDPKELPLKRYRQAVDRALGAIGRTSFHYDSRDIAAKNEAFYHNYHGHLQIQHLHELAAAESDTLKTLLATAKEKNKELQALEAQQTAKLKQYRGIQSAMRLAITDIYRKAKASGMTLTEFKSRSHAELISDIYQHMARDYGVPDRHISIQKTPSEPFTFSSEGSDATSTEKDTGIVFRSSGSGRVVLQNPFTHIIAAELDQVEGSPTITAWGTEASLGFLTDLCLSQEDEARQKKLMSDRNTVSKKVHEWIHQLSESGDSFDLMTGRQFNFQVPDIATKAISGLIGVGLGAHLNLGKHSAAIISREDVRDESGTQKPIYHVQLSQIY